MFHLGCQDYVASLTEPRYCYQKNLLGRNNGPNKITPRMVGAETLFCILIDNQKDDLKYIDRTGSTNISQFEILVARHRGFIWPDIQEKIISQKRSLEKEKKQTIASKNKVRSLVVNCLMI